MGVGGAGTSIPGTASVARGVQKHHWGPAPRQVCMGTQGGENSWTGAPGLDRPSVPR